MRPLISVIVPVYNVEAYLEECADSLLQQTLREIEIILVDDGSTDSSGQICDRYAARDPRIRVIHQENGGLSAARNRGIDLAQADCVMFVDSDDWVAPDYCRKPWEAMQKSGADLVFFGFRTVKKGLDRVVSYPAGPRTKDQALEKAHCYAWNKLYRKELFDTIRFPLGRYHEDIAIMYDVLEHANGICGIPDVLYFYRRREGSITVAKSEKQRKDFFEMNIRMLRGIQKYGFAGAKRAAANFALVYMMIFSGTPEQKEYRICTKILKSVKSPKACFSGIRRFIYLLYRVWPAAFDKVCKLAGTRLLV